MSINRDFKSFNKQNGDQVKISRKSLYLGLSVAVLGLLSLVFLGSGSDPQVPESAEIENQETAPAVVQAPPEPPQPVREEKKSHVPSGSSITTLLGDYFNAQEIYKLNKESKDIFPFTRIGAGHPYRIVTVDGEFESFIYEIDHEEELIISRIDDVVSMERKDIIYDVVVEDVKGVINSSLFGAISTINEQPELAFALADIYGWDINFILDIRAGDTFQALVEKRFRDGVPAGYGDILAAEFVNQGESHKAFRFQNGDGKASYYNEKGQNLRKAFLKAPLSFTRISSGYTMRRLHPIKKVYRAHPAIDYAAPVGTPVKTVGDGSITRKGYGKGNGNYLEVTHSNGYKSMYLHLHGFARGIKRGKRVSQGQVIGYVGNTGMSTGPHLDFRMKRYGKPINPLKLKAPSAKSVSKDHMAAFKNQIAPLLARLESNSVVGSHVAQLDAGSTAHSQSVRAN